MQIAVHLMQDSHVPYQPHLVALPLSEPVFIGELIGVVEMKCWYIVRIVLSVVKWRFDLNLNFTISYVSSPSCATWDSIS